MEEHDAAGSVVAKDETKSEQLRVAVESIKDKCKMILRLISMVPGPEIDEDGACSWSSYWPRRTNGGSITGGRRNENR